MAKNIFVVCEQRDNKIQNVSLELLGVANELAAVTKEKVCAVVLGDKIKEAAKELAGYGADIIYVVEDKELKYYLTEQYSQAVYQVLKTYEPNIVLYGATSIGRDLAPRLSARLRTGLTADCTKLEADAQAYAIQAVQKQLETSPNYIDYMKINNWNGQLPQIIGDGVNPFVNLDSSANSAESKSDKSDSTSKSN